ncbi:Dolichyl-phosphate beta-glucosyltransferase [Orchesella cincta]|uniref:dolichyl-phosphate beta-glucosyltransferase n=1 Tax=Orchesella cincta TaxID=48709 RepID=A0A1D2M9Q5_ORCCI|nr:Dolichyl-phosphate beta-glucosyltransferase [Orchesella cincta]
MEIDILLAFILLMITGILILFLLLLDNWSGGDEKDWIIIWFSSQVCIMLLKDVQPYPNWKRYDTEKYYEDPDTGIKCPFPSLSDSPSLTLSVIVPAYNEEDRLTAMMEDCLPYLERRLENERTFSYEIVIVNDGSKDSTADVAMGYVRRLGSDKVRLLNLEKNRGKGGAVRLGVFSSRGEYILFADADGATRFSDIDKIFTSIKGLTDKAKCKCDHVWGYKVACSLYCVWISGSYGGGFNCVTILFSNCVDVCIPFFVWLFTVRGIRDTQCGFKMFTRSAARIVFHNLHIERWAFDVELLYIAQKLKMPIDEVAVYWTEIEGSKVTPILSWIQMGMDLFAIWLRYTTGRWRLANKGD